MAEVPVAASIPSPKGLPVVGHLHQIARAGLIGHLLNVSRDFPEGIFKLKFGSRVAVFVTDPDLVARATRVFDGLRADALPWTQTEDLLRKAGERWTL